MNSLEHIIFDESSILGWKKNNYSLEIYIDFLLSSKHPMFEKYDVFSEYGCYKTGVLVIERLEFATGLPEENHTPEWNKITGEYKDIAEIDSFNISNGCVIKIEADNLRVLIKGNGIVIRIGTCSRGGVAKKLPPKDEAA
jgi:hypothetical protein